MYAHPPSPRSKGEGHEHRIPQHPHNPGRKPATTPNHPRSRPFLPARPLLPPTPSHPSPPPSPHRQIPPRPPPPLPPFSPPHYPPLPPAPPGPAKSLLALHPATRVSLNSPLPPHPFAPDPFPVDEDHRKADRDQRPALSIICAKEDDEFTI